MDQPYREESKPEDPLTDGELAFWDKVYAEVVYQKGGDKAAEYADLAVGRRRARFGVR